MYGWTFATDHGVTEFTYLTGVSRGGFTAAGSGTLRVVTPGLYAPGDSYAVSAGSSSSTVVADQVGRLSFAVNLGGAHTAEQMAFAPTDIASWTHVTTSVTPLARAASPAAGLGGSAASVPMPPNTAPGGTVGSGVAAALVALGAAVRVFGRRRRSAPA